MSLRSPPAVTGHRRSWAHCLGQHRWAESDASVTPVLGLCSSQNRRLKTDLNCDSRGTFVGDFPRSSSTVFWRPGECVRVCVCLTEGGSENGRNKWLSRCSLVPEPLPLNSETLSRSSHLSEPVSASIRGRERRHVSTRLDPFYLSSFVNMICTVPSGFQGAFHIYDLTRFS